MENKRKGYKCKHCGSEDILWDAYVRWNKELQKDEINSVFDLCFCNNCDGETTVEEYILENGE